ncbi:tRNA (adenosine(37)-N6)-dimethylallyltransferase MiaA, partial [Candidatus Falkowbacteria bacterium]|nr:tRNA (adenosine(37)-N6)-dimethylallyltransferase MiaA [Candidatus Falkowbacteria bacterium]
LPKILIIIGPTASGKTSLSIKLAKKFNGEIISADSRQVYKGMDLGTGKVTRKEMQGIKHYLLDVVSPKKRFTAADYVGLGNKAIKQIQKKGKLPIICGGTGFYIDALLYGLPKTVAPDWKLRAKLEKLSNANLFNKLKRVDPERAKIIDRNNRRRLIRSLEIVIKTGKPIPELIKQSKYDILKIGVKRNKSDLKKRIHKRLIERFRQGMINEVKMLLKQGISWQKLDDFGLEYRFISRYLNGILNREQMMELLETAINQYAKRQITWFKRDKQVFWSNDQLNIEKKVKKWLFDNRFKW